MKKYSNNLQVEFELLKNKVSLKDNQKNQRSKNKIAQLINEKYSYDAKYNLYIFQQEIMSQIKQKITIKLKSQFKSNDAFIKTILSTNSEPIKYETSNISDINFVEKSEFSQIFKNEKSRNRPSSNLMERRNYNLTERKEDNNTLQYTIYKANESDLFYKSNNNEIFPKEPAKIQKFKTFQIETNKNDLKEEDYGDDIEESKVVVMSSKKENIPEIVKKDIPSRKSNKVIKYFFYSYSF